MTLHRCCISIIALLAFPLMAAANTQVTPDFMESLKQKLNDGQLSPEKGPGDHTHTLAEQIQFLEGELLKQQQQTSMPSTVSANASVPAETHAPLAPHNELSNPTQQASSSNMPATYTPSSPQDAQQLRVAGLEARVALLEKQVATLSQQNTPTQLAPSNLGNTYGS